MSGKQKFQVKIDLWSRDVHGLYDYKAHENQIKTSVHPISNQCRIYRNSVHNENYFIASDKNLPKYYDYVCEVEQDENEESDKFWLRWRPNTLQTESRQSNAPCRAPYLVLNKFNSKNGENNQTIQGYPLEFGSVIKLGLFQFKVCEIRVGQYFQSIFTEKNLQESFMGGIYVVQEDVALPEQKNLKNKCNQMHFNNQEENEDNSQTRAKRKMIKKEESSKDRRKKVRAKERNKNRLESESGSESEIMEQKEPNINKKEYNMAIVTEREREDKSEHCKFCLLEEENLTTDPFVSPCLCKGSALHVHLSCFLAWVRSKVKYTEKNLAKTYLLQKSLCEVCRKAYPLLIKHGQATIPLVTVEKPQGPYMILQSMKDRENEPQIMYIIISGFEDSTVRIGRSEQNQVKINDISISRKHCQFFFKGGKFYVKDNESKFGTLLKFQKDHLISDQSVQMQIGRCLYQFSKIGEGDQQQLEDSRSQISSE